MSWLELKIAISSKFVEEISAFLTEAGALAVTTVDAGDQPIYEPDPSLNPMWDNVILTGLFEKNVGIEGIALALKTQFNFITTEMNTVADQDWERVWMSDFKPMQFGERLWVIPSYEKHSSSPHHVILDPGLAFGTGKHPTTALCLQWLDKNIRGGEVVLDYGCGSGILGIAALKLGAMKVYAVDHDPQAILASKENAKQNSLSNNEIEFYLPDEFRCGNVEILIANILANPLINLAATFADLLTLSNQIVLSGILQEQTESVIATYQEWFEILHIANLEDWVRIDAKRR